MPGRRRSPRSARPSRSAERPSARAHAGSRWRPGSPPRRLAGLSAQRLAWRIDAIETGLHERSLAGSVSLRWSEIEAVEPRDGSILLRGRNGARLVIATGRFEPDERIRLERTIARRVKEAAR